MTTPTCTVCGATEEPGRDHTCPVCGADLPDAQPEDTSSTVDPDRSPEGAAGANPPESQPDDSMPEAPRFDAPGSEIPLAEDGHTPPSGAPREDVPSPGAPAEDVPRTEAPLPPPTWPTTAATPTPPPPGGWGAAARPATSPYDPSHPSGLSSAVRTYGMLTHLSAFLGALVALAFIGPLVMWLIRRDEHPFLDHHGKEALNFNLSMLLYFVIGFVASIATLGLGLVVVVPAAVVFFVTWIVTTIVAAVKANAGEGYRYPLSIRFVQD